MTQGQLFEPPSSGSKLDRTISGVACRVLIDVSGYARELDYLMPDQLVESARVGSIVRVRLRNRVVKGWLTSINLVDSQVAPVDLKPILNIYSVGPSAEIVELARWISSRFVGPMRTVLSSASPNRIIKSDPRFRARATFPVSSAELSRAVRTNTSVQLITEPSDTGVDLAIELGRAGQTLIIVKSPSEVDWLVGVLRRNGVSASNYETDWAAGLRGDTIVGTAKAALASLVRPSAFLVLDSHSGHYKMRRSPHWDVSTVLQQRADNLDLPLVFASPFPAVATIDRVDSVARVSAINAKSIGPKVEVLDLCVQEERGSKLLSIKLVEALRKRGNGLIVINRKGSSNLLYCGSCSAAITSEDGSSLMIELDGQLVVPGGTEVRPPLCQQCGSRKLKRYRLGVKGLASQLESLVEGDVVTIDASTKQIPSASFYVGTSAAIYRNLPVSMIAFVDIDSDLSTPGFRTRYKVASQVIAAKRILGSDDVLLAQTRQVEHPFIRWLVTQDPTELVSQERQARRMFSLPPFGHVAALKGPFADKAASRLVEAGLAVLGPNDGSYLAKSQTVSKLCEELAKVRSEFGSGIKIEVDPFDM